METLESRRLLSGNGLLAQYFNGGSLTGPGVMRNDSTVNFNWGNGAPDNTMPVDGYSAEWSGQVQPLYSETYTFNVQDSGGARLYVNGTLLFDHFTNAGAGNWNGTIALTANSKYSLNLQYAENTTTNAGITLSWSSPSQAFQVIPSTQLYSWSDLDFNSGNTPGSSSYNSSSGTYTINGAGTGVLGGSDDCHFMYQTFTGNVDIIARVTSGTNAGLMIRSGLTGSAATGTLLSPNGGQQWMVARPTTGASLVGGTGQTYSDPVWLRLTTLGNIITGYSSTDGVNWAVVWTGQQVTLGSTLYVGMFSYSGNGTTLSTATFDNVKVATTNYGYTTSWLGNSFNGTISGSISGTTGHVQDDIMGLYVGANGLV